MPLHSKTRNALRSSVFGAFILTAPVALAEETAGVRGDFNGIVDAFKESKILFDARIRWEHVEQDGISNNANAVTYRLRGGFETAKFYDTSLLIEFDFKRDIVGDFNSTTNGNTAFPVVADPDSTRLNRFHLTNTSLPDTKITLGRQRIILDDARFVGNVGWRQNEQTFDSVRVQNTSIEGLTFDFSYLEQINRIFGSESAVGTLESDTALINAKYKTAFNDVNVGLTGFAYLIDLEEVPGLSSRTFGFNLDLSHGPWSLKGSYANQSDYADQPADYNVNYYRVAGFWQNHGFELGGGYEVLSGDGTIGFSTPLATLHKFNGFADQFLATPADGIEDIYGKVGYTKKNVGAFSLLKAFAVYHNFSPENASGNFGDEIDVVGIVKFKKLENVKFLAKYANFQSDDGFKSDKEVFWLQVEFQI